MSAATPLTSFQLDELVEVWSLIPYPRIAAVSPLPTKLPWKPPVSAELVAELAVPLVIVSVSDVDAAKVLNENGTLLAFRFHVPPLFEPFEGIVTLALNESTRLLKFTSSVALLSVPAVLFWFVGDVAAASV